MILKIREDFESVLIVEIENPRPNKTKAPLLTKLGLSETTGCERFLSDKRVHFV